MKKRIWLHIGLFCIAFMLMGTWAHAAVSAYVRSLTISTQTVSVQQGKKEKVKATVKVEGGASQKVKAKSSNENIVKVSVKKPNKKGISTIKIKGIKNGTATVTVSTVAKGSNGKAVEKKITVQVGGNSGSAKVENPTDTNGKVIDLKKIWGDTELTEYVDPIHGVHYYLPSELDIRQDVDSNWGDIGYAAYATGMGMKNEFLLAPYYTTVEMLAFSDPLEAEYYPVQTIGNRIYKMAFLIEWNGSQAAQKFVKKYAQKIADSAYVPSDAKPLYYSFSIADDKAVESDSTHYLMDGTVPKGIEKAPEGMKVWTVGTDIPAGNFGYRITYGEGTLSIRDAMGSEKLNVKLEGSYFDKNYTPITLKDGDQICLDAADKDALAVTFNDKSIKWGGNR